MKNYLNTVLDFPKTVNEILPKNNFNELVDNSEKSIYGWIGQVFRVMALVFLVFMLINVIGDGLKYLVNGANNFNESYVEKIENKGTEDEYDASYFTITLLNPDSTDDDDEKELRQEAMALASSTFGYKLNFEGDDRDAEELIFSVGQESDDPGFLGIIANILMILLLSYAAFPISQVISNAGNTVAKAENDMIKFLFKDLVLIIVRTAGYILGLILLFSAFAGIISFVFGELLFIPDMPFTETLVEILLIPITVLDSLLGLILDEGFILGIEFVNETLNLINVPNTFAVDSWSLDGVATLLSMFASVLVVFIILFIALPIWEFIYGLISTLIKWIKGPYIPHKAL
jgi:hypothetical protein